MGFMNGLLGGATGALVTNAITSFIEQHGGVGAIVSEFEQKGFGSTVASWVGKGTNLPINANEIKQVVNNETLKKFADKLGVPVDTIAEKLAQYLPETVNKMTPEGVVPQVGSAA